MYNGQEILLDFQINGFTIIQRSKYILLLGMGSTRSIFNFFVEFMPKKVYHVENSYSKDVLKAF